MLLFLSFGLGSVSPVRAEAVADSNDTFGLQPVGQVSQLGADDIRVILAKIVRMILAFLGIIAVVLIIYAGWLIMTSEGSEDKITEGRRVLTNAVIGLLIILSAVAIVQFILNALSRATGRESDLAGGRAPRIQTFVGSGALGRIVKDHYPFRDEKEVKRNTKIAVTFREAIDPRSLILDQNGNGLIGDCIAAATSSAFDWARNCDRLSTSSVRIYRSSNPSALTEAAALAVPEASTSSSFTFVFRPLDPLGSSTTTVEYTAVLTDRIKKADGSTSAFVGTRDGRYFWNFETDTNMDNTPPEISSIYPVHGASIPRNHIVQLNFNEAMDPTTVQGSASNFFQIIIGTSTGAGIRPDGEWRISNGYRTVEFVSNYPCGQNSCGELMYCFRLDCAGQTNEACSNNFTALARTAEVVPGNGNSFESIPFTGVADMAGNALDTSASSTRIISSGVIRGDGKLASPHKPSIANVRSVGAVERADDNFWWDFTIQNRIDRSSPYIESALPGIDQEDVAEDARLTMNFSQVMWSYTLGDVRLEEYPAGTNGVDPIWFSPRSDMRRDKIATLLDMRHRIFGPNDADLYYFPSIPHTVRAVNQNCLYPGRGPVAAVKNTAPVCTFETNDDGVPRPGTGVNCVPSASASSTSSTDTGCVQTTRQQEGGRDLLLQPNIDQCLSVMKRSDISVVSST
ncbi:MAG: Ig-like domain-containing protein [Candidatus Magasanikbacteria bacterium]|nr:Ig-like domain-containing protein [Candidatus Magasanikbacteria bacterium]